MLRKFIDKLKTSQVFWNIIGTLSNFYPQHNFRKIPKSIIIEASAACNLRCPLCPTHFAMKRRKGFMDFNLFRGIIDEINYLKEKPQICFNFAGEPTLNKDIGKFVWYANKNGFKTFISTNCTMLNHSLSKELILSGLTSIHLCIDGLSKRSHEEYRRGSNFEVVKKNIENFIKIRDNLNRKNPYVVIQTLITSFSENEIEKMIIWAKKIGADEIYFKSLNIGSYTTHKMKEKYAYLLPTRKEFRRKQIGVYRTICFTPIEQAVVYWNGDLGLCCVDFDNQVKLGNIREQGFLETFFSKKVIEKRKKGFLKKYSLCKSCSLGNADYMGFSVKTRPTSLKEDMKT